MGADALLISKSAQLGFVSAPRAGADFFDIEPFGSHRRPAWSTRRAPRASRRLRASRRTRYRWTLSRHRDATQV